MEVMFGLELWAQLFKAEIHVYGQNLDKNNIESFEFDVKSSIQYQKESIRK